MVDLLLIMGMMGLLLIALGVYCARLVSNRKYAEVLQACHSTQFDDFEWFS